MELKKVLSLPSYLMKVNNQWKKLQAMQTLYSEKKWLESIALANEMVISMEDDFYGFYYRGLCHFQLKFFEEAIEDFKRAIANAEKNTFPKLMQESIFDCNLRIAMVHRVQRNYDLALELIDSAIKLFPDSIDGHILKAHIYQDLGRTIDALDSINSGLIVKPKNSDLLKFKDNLVYQYSREQNEKRKGTEI
jgi:tetratricopeptide (TPR) repeat protein